jgi:hypothetical protein
LHPKTVRLRRIANAHRDILLEITQIGCHLLPESADLAQ